MRTGSGLSGAKIYLLEIWKKRRTSLRGHYGTGRDGNIFYKITACHRYSLPYAIICLPNHIPACVSFQSKDISLVAKLFLLAYSFLAT